MSEIDAYALLQKIAAGEPLTVAEFRLVGERLNLTREQIGAALLTFKVDPMFDDALLAVVRHEDVAIGYGEGRVNIEDVVNSRAAVVESLAKQERITR